MQTFAASEVSQPPYQPQHTGPARSRTSTRPPGFTLLEVLVVTAIITVLISILLPSLGRARSQARAVVCLSNLRQMGHAALFYLNRYKVYPPVRLKEVYDSASNQWVTYVNRYGRSKPRWQWFFDYGIGPLISPADLAAGKEDMTNEVFTCPSLNTEDARSPRNGSYGFNWQYLGNSLVKVGTRHARWPVRESLVKNPGRTVMVADSRGGDLPHGPHSYTLDPPRWAEEHNTLRFGPSAGKDGPYGYSPVEMRHSQRGNVLFVDGHAEPMQLKQLGYVLDGQGVPIPNGTGASNHLWTGLGRDPLRVP